MKKRIRKEFKELAIVASVFLLLYVTGLHTEVAAFAQRIILTTGVITPDTDLDEASLEEVDYDFQLKNLNGEIVHLSDYKGKVIFLNLWATWCAPCIAEMPNIQGLYDKIDDKNIEFIMLSMDQKEAKAKKFIDKKGFTFPVFMAASPVPEMFKVPSIPTTFVISPEGKVVSKKVGMANYDKKRFKNFLEGLVSQNEAEVPAN